MYHIILTPLGDSSNMDDKRRLPLHGISLEHINAQIVTIV